MVFGLTLLVLWIAVGLLAGRITVVDFESRFGHGQAEGLLPALMIMSGPIGLVSTLLMMGKGVLPAVLGMGEAPHRPDTILHSERNFLTSLLVKGVKGLPENKDYWSEARGWNSTSNSFTF